MIIGLLQIPKTHIHWIIAHPWSLIKVWKCKTLLCYFTCWTKTPSFFLHPGQLSYLKVGTSIPVWQTKGTAPDLIHAAFKKWAKLSADHYLLLAKFTWQTKESLHRCLGASGWSFIEIYLKGTGVIILPAVSYVKLMQIMLLGQLSLI